MPIVGSKVKFQPCYVGDIGDAVNAIIKNRIKKDFYETGGPKRYTLEDLIGIMLKEIRRSNMILPMPYSLSKFQAFFTACTETIINYRPSQNIIRVW